MGLEVFGLTVSVLYLVGIASAVDALFKSRQPQAKTAWILGLAFAPLFVVPLYWVFGRRKFETYRVVTQEFDELTAELREDLGSRARETRDNVDGDESQRTKTERTALEKLSRFEFSGGNSVSLLIDGPDTFDAILDAIDSAQDYVLVQFYVIRDDRIGHALCETLRAASQRGVRVLLLYDDIGSIALSADYKRALSEAGVQVKEFSGGRVWLGRFRLNFRNHRKIVVVDGETGFVGGLNVGDEYLGRDESIGDWRDTHLKLTGPAVAGLQYIFCRDWYFATREFPDLHWTPASEDDGVNALIVGSGPNSEFENCGLLFAHLIASAEKRLWLASPYFVPDGRILAALQLAALRGVDVRIMVPRRSDNPMFKYVPFAFFPEVLMAGARIFFYEDDFMHQKVILVDDDYGVVGTANLDNRSFYLNFETMCVIHDSKFCGELHSMLERDLESCTELSSEDATARTLAERLATNVTGLFAPVL